MSEDWSAPPGERIDVRSQTREAAVAQLAARWAERFAPHERDTPSEALRRFRLAYDYVDAVASGLTPPDKPRV